MASSTTTDERVQRQRDAANEIASKRAKFGAPVSRTQVSAVDSGITKGDRSRVGQKKTRSELTAYASQDIGRGDLSDSTKELLSRTNGLYAKSWGVKSACILLSLRTR